MRHNLEIKIKVRKLREDGLSLGQIYQQTKIPKTTIRTWIKDIRLSEEQFKVLKNRTQKALQEGRIKKEQHQRKARLINERNMEEKGIKEVGKLSERDFLITGIALYWAEGFKNKHEHRLGFCNSDPEMIIFYIKWLKLAFKINETDLIARLTLNESYKEKSSGIEAYWLEITKIPRSQFGKTFFQKTKWKKQFSDDNYHGVLRIHVKESLDSLLLMKGWIQGLKLNLD